MAKKLSVKELKKQLQKYKGQVNQGKQLLVKNNGELTVEEKELFDQIEQQFIAIYAGLKTKIEQQVPKKSEVEENSLLNKVVDTVLPQEFQDKFLSKMNQLKGVFEKNIKQLESLQEMKEKLSKYNL